MSVERLDNLLESEPGLSKNAYLKVDTQGFEKEVLDGAGSHLSDFSAIQLELPLRSLYEEQPLLLEMLAFMEKRGFAVAMAKENGFDDSKVRLLELDVVFVPKRKYS